MTKILIDEATVKLVLEGAANYIDALGGDSRKYRQALAQPDFWEGYVPEPEQPAQQEFVSPGGGYVPAIPAQQALDNKAENARELGLDYEPAQDSGVVTAGGFDPRTQRTWVGLTDEEIESLDCVYLNWLDYEQVEIKGDKEFARAIEAKLRSKNEDRN